MLGLRYRYIVGFFVNRDGNIPVQEYIYSRTDVTDYSVIIDGIQSLAIAGQELIGSEMAKHIDGSIFELRKDRHRIFYVQDGIKFVLLSAFYKDRQKTPPKEIRRAQDHYIEYQETGNFFAIKLPSL